jgi:hypothetical protein
MTPIVNRIMGIMPKSRFADGSATKTAPNHGGGWMTGGTAIKLADDRANTAVVAALTPICVEKFLQLGG